LATHGRSGQNIRKNVAIFSGTRKGRANGNGAMRRIAEIVAVLTPKQASRWDTWIETRREHWIPRLPESAYPNRRR
jgi:hypothetical protein